MRPVFRTRLAIAALSLISVGLTSANLAYSDDAVVLPKGLSRLFVDTRFFLPFTNRFDNNGDSVAFGAPLSRTLNNSVFTALPPGTNLGTTNVSVTRNNAKEMTIQPAFGLTDRLTIGANIYYTWYENTVDASINTSGANLGINPLAPGGIAPLGTPGTRPATVNDINNLLASQFGVKPITTRSDSGLGDLEVGGRYQYYRGEDFRAAFTGGVRFPTGKTDDPNDLLDVKFGNGVYALLFQFQQDYMRQTEGLGKRLGFPDPGEFFINTTIRYEYNLPGKQTLMVCPAGQLVCSTRDNVNTKIGDVVQAEVSGKFGLPLRGLIFSPLFLYGYKFKDHYSGDRGLNYGGLSDQLDRTTQYEDIYIMTLTYTTIPLYLQKKLPFTGVISVSYRDRFAGSGGKGDSRYIGLTVQAFF